MGRVPEVLVALRHALRTLLALPYHPCGALALALPLAVGQRQGLTYLVP